MKKIYKYILIASCFLSILALDINSVSASTIAGAYDVSTSIVRDNGIISISVSGKLTKEGASRWSQAGSSMYFRFFKIDEETTTSDASVFSNSNAEKLNCSVNNTGSGIGNAVEGDTFFCSTNKRSTQVTYGLDYGWYIFSVTIGSDYITGIADKKNTKASDIYEENEIFIEKISATAGTEDTVNAPTVSVSGNNVTITGVLNSKAAESAARNPSGFSVKYGEIKISPIKNHEYTSLTQNASITIKKSGADSVFSSSFSVEKPGYYIFGIHYAETTGAGDRQGTTFRWISTFDKFSVEGNIKTTVQLVTPITPNESDPENPKVKIQVKVNNITDTGDAFIQLGHVEQVSGTSNGTCVLDPDLVSARLNLKKISGQDLYAEYEFSGSNNLTPGIYCVAAKAGSMDDFTKFTGKKDIFKIGNVTIPDTLTIDPNANQNGCVIPEGGASTTGYCLLAPLPGVGDAGGYVDTTTGIEKYINSIIRLILGLIGVLSVVMIVVGGIEYMSTVNIGEKEGAKHRITQALFGLIIALGSYAILNTINPDLVNIKIHIPGANVDGGYTSGGEDDEDVGVSPTATPPSNVSIPDGNAQDLAKQILQNSSIVLLDNVPGRNEVSSGPKQNIQDTADGKAAWRSSWGDMGHTQQALSGRMLAGMLAIANQGVKIQVNTIAGGDHASNSRHYYGIAFDIQSAPSEIARTKQILGLCQATGATELLGPCNNNTSLKLCKATGYPTNADHQTHIHCGWPRSDINNSPTSSGQTVAGTVGASCGIPSVKPDCEGVTASCKKYADRIDALISDKKIARFMKINMVEESGCKINAISPATSTGYAYGIFQLQPGTAKDNVKGCGVTESQINSSWLMNEANVDKMICIQKNFIDKIVNRCGSDIRNMAAGQEGIGWCDASNDCTAEKSCIPSNSYVRKWECPWDNPEHTKTNTGLEEARNASKRMQYCSDNPGSWMKS